MLLALTTDLPINGQECTGKEGPPKATVKWLQVMLVNLHGAKKGELIYIYNSLTLRSLSYSMAALP